MNKYRVLKPYPKQITNSGRLVTLKKGSSVYLKKEAQVLRLISLGFLKPIVDMPKKPAKIKPAKEVKTEAQAQQDEHKKASKAEYLNKKNKAE
jgi:hypothetical protein